MAAEEKVHTVMLLTAAFLWIGSCGYGTLTVSTGPILFGAFCFVLSVLIAAGANND